MIEKKELSKDKIFLNEDVEDRFDTLFKIDENKPERAPIEDTEKIKSALTYFKDSVDRYIYFCCIQLPLEIKKIIEAETREEFQKSKDMSANRNKHNSYSEEITSLSKRMFSYYRLHLLQIQNFIFFRYTDLCLDVPAFKDQFNITLLEEMFYYSFIKDENLENMLIILITIIYATPANKADFDENFNGHIMCFFYELFRSLTSKVVYMYNYFIENMQHLLLLSKTKTKRLEVINYVSSETLNAKSSTLLVTLDKFQSKIDICFEILNIKLESNLFKPIEMELKLLIKELGSNDKIDKTEFLNLKKFKFGQAVETIYLDFKAIYNDIVEQHKILDAFLLKFGNEKLIQLERIISHTSQVFKSAVHNSTQNTHMCADQVYEIIILKKKTISGEDIDNFMQHVKTSVLDDVKLLQYNIKRIERRLNEIRALVLKKNTKKEICLDLLDPINSDIIIKLNGVYNYFDAIWREKLFYFETVMDAYLIVRYTRKSRDLVKNKYLVIHNDEMYQNDYLMKQVYLNFQMLSNAYESAGKIFLDIFETNFLNEIQPIKDLLKHKLIEFMELYKEDILLPLEKLRMYEQNKDLDPEFFDIDFDSYNGMEDKELTFTPYNTALDLYQNSTGESDLDQMEDLNHKMILQIKENALRKHEEIHSDNKSNAEIQSDLLIEIKNQEAMNKALFHALTSPKSFKSDVKHEIQCQNSADMSRNTVDNSRSQTKSIKYIIILVVLVVITIISLIIYFILNKK
ncbi:hypothetical protein COBT_000069 [Conglomerata obtusa]